MIVAYGTGSQNLLINPQQKSSPTTSPVGEYAKEGIRSTQYSWYTNEVGLDWANQPEFGFSYCFAQARGGSWNWTDALFELRDGNGARMLRIDSDTAESLNFREYISLAGATNTFKDTTWMTDNAVHRMDIHCLIDPTVGYLKIWFDSVLLVDFTGDTTGGGLFTGAAKARWGGADYGEIQTISNVFVTDGDDPTEIIMYQHDLGNVGRFSEMSGEAMSLNGINGFDDGDVVVSDAANQTFTIGFEELPVTFEGYEIMCVALDSRMAADSGGANPVAFVMDDGVNVAESASFSGNGKFKNVQSFFTTAPDGTTWDRTKVNSCDIGVRSK